MEEGLAIGIAPGPQEEARFRSLGPPTAQGVERTERRRLGRTPRTLDEWRRRGADVVANARICQMGRTVCQKCAA